MNKKLVIEQDIIGDHMIQNYVIKCEHGEEILYLFLDYNYEFGSFESSDKSFFKQLKDFLNNKFIHFNGKKIVIIVSGIIIGTIFLNNHLITNNNIIEKKQNDLSYVSEVILKDFNNQKNFTIQINDNKISTNNDEIISNNDILNIEKSNDNFTNNQINIKENNIDNNIKKENNVDNITNTIDKDENENNDIKENVITVYRANDEILNINLEEYLIGVVAGEMPASFHIEALKAQAIIARTYTLKSIEQNKKLTDTSSTQIYLDDEQMKLKWGNDYLKYYSKIKKAIEETEGKYITYNNKYIDAVYFSTSNGYTEDAKYVWGYDIPYLKSVKSPWDIGTTNYTKTINKSFEEISNILGINVNENTIIKEIIRDSSQRITSITINDKIFSGKQIRSLFGLNSTDFDINITEKGFNFITRGYGHGVGMSQYGANGMAKEGYNCDEIIYYYYQNVTIEK